MGEVTFNSFRIRGRTAAELFFGLTTLKVVEKAIRSISNGVDRTGANGIARIRVGGADPILEATMGGRNRGIPLIGADLVALVTAVGEGANRDRRYYDERGRWNTDGAAQAIRVCQAAVAERIQRDGFRNVTFRNVVPDNNPGRNDFVNGFATAGRVGGAA